MQDTRVGFDQSFRGEKQNVAQDCAAAPLSWAQDGNSTVMRGPAGEEKKILSLQAKMKGRKPVSTVSISVLRV